MKNKERQIQTILAEIRNPDKRVEDVAWELFKMGEEKAFDRAKDKSAVHGDDIKKYLDQYMEQVHDKIDQLLEKEYGKK